MFVRLALEEDFDEVVAMARINAQTRPHLVFSEDRCRRTLANYIARANPTIFVCEQKRALIGFLAAGIHNYDAFDGLYTSQQVLFVKPENRGSRAAILLMKQLVAWSEMLGATEIIGGNDNEFNSERTAKFLEHFGFTRVGFAMRRIIQNGHRQERQ